MAPYLLFTPGPVKVAENLRAAITKHDICHREVDFDELLGRIEQKLLSLFEIERRQDYRAVMITGSGSAANESMLSSVVGDGHILILANGEFGERLHKISEIYNENTHLIKLPWGQKFDPKMIQNYLKNHEINVIAMVHHETCSGMLNPLDKIGTLAKENEAIFIVDGVSSVGAEFVNMAGCNIAFCSSSSSKAIGSYPGLSFIIGLKEEFEKLHKFKVKTVYLNLATYYKFLTSFKQTPNTPAIPLLFAFDQALSNILHQGVSNRYSEINNRANYLRSEMRKLNLTFLIDEDDMCSVLTTVRVPRSINVTELRKKLRDSAIIVYEGKGCFKDKFFQVGNIGEISFSDIIFFIQKLKDALISPKTGDISIMAATATKLSSRRHLGPQNQIPISTIS